MNNLVICSDRHPQVAYEFYDDRAKKTLKCPVCEALDEIAGLKEDLKESEEERERLQTIVDAEEDRR